MKKLIVLGAALFEFIVEENSGPILYTVTIQGAFYRDEWSIEIQKSGKVVYGKIHSNWLIKYCNPTVSVAKSILTTYLKTA